MHATLINRQGLLSSYELYPEGLTMNLRLKTFSSTRRLLLIARTPCPTETVSYACNFAKRLLTLLAKKSLKPSQCNSCPSDQDDLQVSLNGVVHVTPF